MTSDRRNVVSTMTVATVAALVMIVAVPPASAGEPKPGDPTTIVMKLHEPSTLSGLEADYALEVVDPLVPTRGLFVVAPDGEPMKKGDLKKLAKDLVKDSRVEWAEVDADNDGVEDDRFHAWPDGRPASTDFDSDDWANQEALQYLELDQVHRQSTGKGVIVAVLDTGVDMDHPAARRSSRSRRPLRLSRRRP